MRPERTFIPVITDPDVFDVSGGLFGSAQKLKEQILPSLPLTTSPPQESSNLGQSTFGLLITQTTTAFPLPVQKIWSKCHCGVHVMTMTVTYDYDSFRSDLRKKMHRLGTGRATKSDEFSEKFQRGGGGFIFNPKIYIADFCHYKWYFGHEFWKKFAT